ncbi:anthranilate phosphoribosyltransferase [Corynebacterium sp. SCR221107]|uniref:anthranilate phosphoribosyltransferase n=1 Tax=Corynebacterium sp. SCR221107 TaxID=3017361 RepID=UPI0022EC80B1|nr:anthranilate phosphoribosyltransferase [Corynebacterium sp. SCR221107]WBT08759.1 anthranilate phosphoribosyltransferase [Corynebacterium sp. SCR221107]
MSTEDNVGLLLKYLDNFHPTIEEAEAVFRPLTFGEYEDIHIAALLATLRTRGETFADIAGAARAFLDAARPFPISGKGLLDTAGTGGDGANTINITTGASLIAAVGGAKVVKCGNRSVSSKSGSADVLEALNIPLDLDPERALRQFEASNFTFLFAPAYHPAVAHVMPVRRALKVPTIFNTLGPIIAPAKPEFQVMGVAKPQIGEMVAETFRVLGRGHAIVVHGSGTDEIAVHGPTKIWEVRGEEITHYEITPDDLGLGTYALSELAGGDGAENARLMRQSFAGKGPRAHRDALAANAGGMFYVTGITDSIKEGAELAIDLLESGQVNQWLKFHEEANYGK